MEWREFLEVIIPSILSRREDYYVKGGRAYNAYFRKQIDSTDWDVVGTSDFKTHIQSELKRYSKEIGLTLEISNQKFPDSLTGKVNDGFQFGFDEHSASDSDPYFLDLIISEEIGGEKYSTLAGINYMIFMDFVADFILTYGIREKNVSDYIKSIGDEGTSVRDSEKFNKAHNTNFDITKSFDSNREEMKRFLGNLSENPAMKKYIKDEIIDGLDELRANPSYIEIDAWTEHFDDDFIVEDEEKIWSILEDLYSEIIGNIYYYNKSREEHMLSEKKFTRTGLRLDVIMDISWQSLSDHYKIYVLSLCGNSDLIKLFDVEKYPGCRAYLDCKKIIIIKDTSGCRNKINYK